MRRIVTAFTVAAAAFAAATAFAQDRIVAVVNNEVITQKDLESFTMFTRMQLSQKLEGAALEEKLATMKQDLLQRLIEDRLILQEAKKSGVKVDESRVKAKVAEVKKRYDTEKDFAAALVQQGLSEADIESRIRDQMMMYSLIDAKIRSKIQVTPGEITKYYTGHRQEMMLPERREVISVPGSDEQDARAIARELRDGKTPDDLVREKNIKVSNFSCQKGELKKEVDEAVFALSAGGVSDPVKVNDAFYVFVLREVVAPKQQELTEVQDRISEIIFQDKMQEQVAAWLDGLKKNSYIRIME